MALYEIKVNAEIVSYAYCAVCKPIARFKLGTHYPCHRAVFTGPCPRPVNTAGGHG